MSAEAFSPPRRPAGTYAGQVDAMLFGALTLVVTIFVLYGLIRLAVRHGMSDALRSEDDRRTRQELGLGRPRSPNSRPVE